MNPRAALLAVAAAATFWNAPALGQLSPRYGHTAVYDSKSQRMVVFGGTDGAGLFYDDVWELSLGNAPQWTRSTPTGGPPSSRAEHCAIYDPVGDRMLVFGGLSADGHLLNDVWSLSLSNMTWTPLQPSGVGPSARFRMSAVYDPICGRMLVYGGTDLSFEGYPEVWSLSLEPAPKWEQLALAPSSGLPQTRYDHSAIYDPVRQRMVVFSGAGSGVDFVSNDIWALSLGPSCASAPAWTELHPTGVFQPPQLSGHSAIYDFKGDRMIVFGGSDGNRPRNDVWMLSLGDTTWSVMPPSGEAPSGRSDQSAVNDSASGRMVLFGGWPDDNEPTWAVTLAPAMRWSPWWPEIEPSQNELQLPPVTVGDMVPVAFSISNVGMEPLRITNVRLPHAADGQPVPGMRLSSPPPFQLAWNEARAETLLLAGGAPADVHDSLVIVSDDPNVPRLSLRTNLRVLGLDFQSRALGVPERAPLGVSFDVVVTPDPGVHIEGGTLFYRIADGRSEFDSLPLTSLSTDFIATVPASAVTEHGVEYYVQVENEPYTATRPLGAPAILDTQRVAPPGSIVDVHPQSTSGANFLSGREIPVDVFLPTGAIFRSGALHYRRGGETSWNADSLTMRGVLGAVIPDSIVGPRGVEYWVDAKTLTDTLRFPATVDAFDTIQVLVPNLVEPREHPALRYRLLSVPLDFGEDYAGGLDGLLVDQFYEYDPVNWRAFLYDPGLNENVEYSSAPQRFQPKPGVAFWLISRGPHRVDTSPSIGRSTPTGREYPVLLAPGWNAIGNPFDFPVAWVDVRRDATVVDDIVAFDPSLGKIGDYEPEAPSVLEPFEGYFVHATQATTLWVAPREATVVARGERLASAPARNTLGAAEGGAWRVRLEARTDDAIDSGNDFGLDPGAEAGLDRLDRRKPPPAPGPYVRVAFPHPEWREQSGEFRRDLRALGAPGETWELQVRSSKRGEAVTIQLAPESASPTDRFVRLIDRERGTVTDLWSPSVPREEAHASASYSIVSLGPDRPYRLGIVVGTEDYVNRAPGQDAAPLTRPSLDPGAPNPFRAATGIRFGLPRRERVTLEVYDVLGDRVATLLEGSELPPGHHALVWDGTTWGGGQAPSGVYLLRMEVGAERLTRRLVRVR